MSSGVETLTSLRIFQKMPSSTTTAVSLTAVTSSRHSLPQKVFTIFMNTDQ